MAVKTPARKTWSVEPSYDRVRWFGYPNGDKPAPAIPSWVPAAGAVAVYTSGGAVLTNNWRDTHDNALNDPFHSRKQSFAYSTHFLHPTWRDYGGVLWFGGGHANTNYNGVHMLTFAQDTMYFERVLDATDWAAADPDTGEIEPELNSYGEVTASVGGVLKVGSGHSYGNGDVIGGHFEKVMRQSYKYTGGGDISAQAYHTLDLTNPATASSARQWVRQTNTLGTWANSSPNCTQYVAGQDRIYFMSRTSANLQWFDRATKTWEVGSNAGWGYPSADSDAGDPVTGGMEVVPERNLLLAFYRQGGNLVIQYAQTNVTQPTVATATLGTTLAVPVDGGKAVTWCSRSSRLLVFGVTGNTDKVYEITIPATLTDSWTVEAVSITGGSIDPVAIAGRSGTWGKGCRYHDAIRAVVMVSAFPDAPGANTVTVYRPRNT